MEPIELLLNSKPMKYRKLSLMSILIILFIPALVQATSGACSSHSGVNCNAGRQPNGRVYCNDGWTDSVVEYDYMVMCEGSHSTCLCSNGKYVSDIEKLNTVKDKAIRNIDKELEKIEQLREMGSRALNDPYYKKIEIALHISKGRLVTNYMHYLCNCTSVDDTLEEFAADDYEKSKSLALKMLGMTYEIEIARKNWDKDDNINETKMQCQPNATNIGGDCICNEGYKKDFNGNCIEDCGPYEKLVNGQCFVKTTTEICNERYGYSSYFKGYDDNYEVLCECEEGYELNSSKTACIKKSTEENKENSLFKKLLERAYVVGNSLNNVNIPSREYKISCPNDYALSLDKKRCIKIPEHSHAVNSPIDVWLCDDGYKEVGNTCVSINQPKETQEGIVLEVKDLDSTMGIKIDLENDEEVLNKNNEGEKKFNYSKNGLVGSVGLFFAKSLNKLKQWLTNDF